MRPVKDMKQAELQDMVEAARQVGLTLLVEGADLASEALKAQTTDAAFVTSCRRAADIMSHAATLLEETA